MQGRDPSWDPGWECLNSPEAILLPLEPNWRFRGVIYAVVNQLPSEDLGIHMTYVGQTIDLKDRWKQHQVNARTLDRALRDGRQPPRQLANSSLYLAMVEHGVHNFLVRAVFAQLFHDPDSRSQWLNQTERELISEWDTRLPQYGYNLNRGGQDRGKDHAAITKLRISQAMHRFLAENPDLAAARSATTSTRLLSTWDDPEKAAAIRAAQRAGNADPEVKARRSLAQIARHASPADRAEIMQFLASTSESMSEILRLTQVDREARNKAARLARKAHTFTPERVLVVFPGIHPAMLAALLGANRSVEESVSG